MGEVAEVVGGGTPKASDPSNFSEKGSPWITPADLSGFEDMYIRKGRRDLSEKGLRSCAATMMPAGSVLMSSRAPIGYLAIAAGPLSTNQGFKSFVCRQGVVPEYIYFWLRFIRLKLEEMGSGSTFAEISGRRAKEIPILLPPTAEQHRIAAALQQMLPQMAHIRNRLAHIPEILKRFRQSVLTAACSGRLTEDWRQRNPGIKTKKVLMRVDGSPALTTRAEWETPDTWIWYPIREIVHPERSAAYGVLQPGEDLEEGIPFVRVCDIQGGVIVGRRLKRISPAIAVRYARTRLHGGEVLVSLVGTIGRTAVVPRELAGANVARAVGVLPLSDDADPHFVHFALSQPSKNAELVDLAREVARKTLNLGLLKAVRVPLPPLPEQLEIKRRVQDLFKFARIVEQSLIVGVERTEKLTQAIIAKGFRGELVPTEADLARHADHGYEPAAELLSRVRAQREKPADGRKRTRGSGSSRELLPGRS